MYKVMYQTLIGLQDFMCQFTQNYMIDFGTWDLLYIDETGEQPKPA